MTDFWFAFGIFGLAGVPFMILFLVGGVDLKHKLGGAFAVLIFWLLASGGVTLDNKGKKDVWNGGYCECGTHWELRGAAKSRMGNETKYYQCPNCYAEITK